MQIVAPSILSADFTKLGADIESIKNAGAQWLHFDVMDGRFVPNISFGIPVLKCVRGFTDMFLDAHLMIVEPIKYVKAFASAGADSITIHVESDTEENIGLAIEEIIKQGKKAGISLKPGTPLSAIEKYLPLVDLVLVMTVEPGFGGQKFMGDMMEKVSELKKLREEKGYKYLIQIDGGVNGETGAVAAAAGTDVLVAGSYVFGAKDVKAAVESLFN